MAGYATASAVMTAEGRLRVLDPFEFDLSVRALGLGVGETVTVRVERPEDAVLHARYKHLFGHVFTPVSRFTGHSTADLCLMAKAQPGFMPDGKTSLTQLTREEMDVFIKNADEWLRRECPDAFEAPAEHVA